MQPIRTFNVSPALPPRLEPLRKLAHNLHWDWDVETKDLFRRLDPNLWETTHHNPVLMLGTISQARLESALEDDGFLAQMERAEQRLEDYILERSLEHRHTHREPLVEKIRETLRRSTQTWYRKHRMHRDGTSGQPSHALEQHTHPECFAYFSMEFGLVDCLPIYSGGLGVLAGDHLKSASDLGLPLVGVGLLYQQGYFAQYLTPDGWQQERYPTNDFYNLPLHLETYPDGSELRIGVDLPGRTVYARIWRVQVGTVPLYLLDTNIEPNNPYDHDITDQLYGGDLDMRLHQEIILGIGGVKMLKALGLKPTVYHMNEGHSAFLTLERIRMLIEEGLSFAEARQVVQASQMFTTHTPVAAGFDLFPSDKMLHHLGHYAHQFGLPPEAFLSLGREHTGDLSSPFSMATLAIKTASFINGVSQLHGIISREMFHEQWAEWPVEEVPITSITNGVHARSCVAPSTQDLFDRYLGPNWSTASGESPVWDRVKTIPDEELWRNHERCRSDMIVFVRERLKASLRNRGASPLEIDRAGEALDPSALTIGFARRFATYKRATLFMRDRERIKKLILNKQRPVQFVIAGKAHPKDLPGKELIREIVRFSREEDMIHSVVFIPDYDIYMSRLLVSGCDVWMNTPRRPREASGTSGMKAAMNGLLNLSVPDGWWDEADYFRTGWAIGRGEAYDDLDYQDDVEVNALYNLLEKEVVPLFYERDSENLPRGWIQHMKDAITLNCPQFNTARMVADYAQKAYFPISDRYFAMIADHYNPAKELANWKQRIFEHWYDMQIEDLEVSDLSDLRVNQELSVKAHIRLAAFTPDDVQVEVFQGAIDTNGAIVGGTSVVMDCQGQDRDGRSVYTASFAYHSSGFQGFSLRILPKHPYLSNPRELGLILWARA